MTGRQTAPDDWRDIAAEFALGLLSGDELQAARALDRSDSAFHAEAARWRGRLAPMLNEIPEVAPPAANWNRIAVSTTSGTTGQSNIVELRRRVRRWQGFTAAASAIAATLALVVATGTLRPPAVPPPAPRAASAPMVAMLGKDPSATAVVASWDPAAQQLVLAVPGTLPAQANHAHELWVIPPGGKPRSLGTMPRTRQMHMKLAEALARLLDQGSTIAISVEPAGGSPTGAPTGPVIASGALKPA